VNDMGDDGVLVRIFVLVVVAAGFISVLLYLF